MKNRIILFFALSLLSTGAGAQSNIISTIAGNGTMGYSGDGSPATSYELSGPEATAVDASGNVYVADRVNNRIRKIDASTGAISTIAGTGTAGYSGDGTATAMKLNSPSGIVLDNSGNIYITDFGNYLVRKISSGTLTTIAGTAGTVGTGTAGDGGAATAATFGGPLGIGIDASGNLFIADAGLHRVRKISAGIINNFAGTGVSGSGGDGGAATLATLTNPCSIACDATGGVYISDAKIRFVNSTGTINTAPGGLTNCFGIARDGCGNIYATFASPVIYKINTSGVSSVYAGTNVSGFSGDGGAATAARITGSVGICVDNSGNTYFTDAQRIRKVSNGLLSTANSIAGSATICAGSTTTLTIAAGTPGATINLSPSGSFTLDAMGHGSITLNPSTSTNYTGTISLGGCSYTVPGTFHVTVTPLPVVGGPTTAHLAPCPAIALTVSGGGGATYTWSPSTYLSAATGASVNMSPTGSTGSITYTVTDGTGCVSLPRMITILSSSPCRMGNFLSVNDVNETAELKVYPNPTTGTFTIELPYAEDNAMMNVTDLSGRNVITQTLNANKQNVDMASYPAGIYLLNITMGDKQYHEKIMVQ